MAINLQLKSNAIEQCGHGLASARQTTIVYVPNRECFEVRSKVLTAMGNAACYRGCEVKTNDSFPLQEEIDVDWSDEGSIHQRSAVNSLHNYALGKMVEDNLAPRGTPRKRSRILKRRRIKFVEGAHDILYSSELYRSN